MRTEEFVTCSQPPVPIPQTDCALRAFQLDYLCGMDSSRAQALDVLHHPRQPVRSTTLFKLGNRNPTRLVQKPNWTRLRGKSENVYSGTRNLCLIDRGKIGSPCTGVHIFNFAPKSRPFWLLYQSRPISIFQLK